MRSFSRIGSSLEKARAPVEEGRLLKLALVKAITLDTLTPEEVINAHYKAFEKAIEHGLRTNKQEVRIKTPLNRTVDVYLMGGSLTQVTTKIRSMLECSCLGHTLLAKFDKDFLSTKKFKKVHLLMPGSSIQTNDEQPLLCKEAPVDKPVQQKTFLEHISVPQKIALEVGGIPPKGSRHYLDYFNLNSMAFLNSEGRDVYKLSKGAEAFLNTLGQEVASQYYDPTGQVLTLMDILAKKEIRSLPARLPDEDTIKGIFGGEVPEWVLSAYSKVYDPSLFIKQLIAKKVDQTSVAKFIPTSAGAILRHFLGKSEEVKMDHPKLETVISELKKVEGIPQNKPLIKETAWRKRLNALLGTKEKQVQTLIDKGLLSKSVLGFLEKESSIAHMIQRLNKLPKNQGLEDIKKENYSKFPFLKGSVKVMLKTPEGSGKLDLASRTVWLQNNIAPDVVGEVMKVINRVSKSPKRGNNKGRDKNPPPRAPNKGKPKTRPDRNKPSGRPEKTKLGDIFSTIRDMVSLFKSL